uniref:Conserved hypothetical plastid protein n=1 Tax=Bulboplastis apyrenoidosa TaxID=1070855 RepID=A0A1Y9TMA1_9RHOD|nr:conserved hypothetical plastid protein [Bulboplastis apyrenoidosa]ARO90810.1 conserved hypothetical plastid protein [Bulboplastis apyrenoidosa]
MTLFAHTLQILSKAISNFLELYFILIIIQYSLGWITAINWYREPFYTIANLTDPYIKIFEGILPSSLGIDLSILFATLFLRVLISVCKNISFA